ncbi:MAG: PQQ-binding-like beta-propeller repeat protein [Planctomycetota bacterium]
MLMQPKNNVVKQFALVLGLSFFSCGCTKHSKSSSRVDSNDAQNAAEFQHQEGNCNDSWPRLLGPFSNASISADGYDLSKLAGSPKPVWQASIGTGYGAPVIADQTVVIMGRDDDQEFVRSMDLQSGSAKWNHAYPTSFECSFEYSNGPYSTPTIIGDRVLAWSAEGTLRCLKLDDGELCWKRDLRADYDAKIGDFPFAASPVADEETVFVNVGGRSGESGVVAVSLLDGETKWTTSSDATSHATPVIGNYEGRRILFVLGYDFLTAIDPQHGAVLWQHEFHARNREMGKFNSTSPLLFDRRIFIAGYAAGAESISLTKSGQPDLDWQVNRRAASNQMAPLVRTPSGILTYGSDRKLTCLDSNDGSVVFREGYEFGGEPQWFLCGDLLVVLGMNGRLFVLDSTEIPFPIVYACQSPVVTTPCFTTPVAAGGLLLVRGQAELASFDISKSQL